MDQFRYKADILPTTLFFLLFLADVSVLTLADNLYLMTGWMLLTLPAKACICSWNHHHQHLPFFKNVYLNRSLELVFALQTGITTNAWVLHHVLGHHLNYLDQSKDESTWQRKDGSKMNATEYTIKTAATGYWRAFGVGKRHNNHQQVMVRMSLLVIFILALCALFFGVAKTLIIFVVPMVIGLTVTAWHTYYHHAGLETDEHHYASYNITHRWYNILTGNLGYHTAHHMKMGLHWSKLPEYHAKVADKIPQEYYRPPCFPFTLLPAE